MLDKTTEGDVTEAPARVTPAGGALPRKRTGLLRRVWQTIVTFGFSSLTRRIVFLNVASLLALVIGILYLSQSRAFFIEARVRSLVVQAEIIASAIAASATVETDAITIDPERLLELQTGENYSPSEEQYSATEFPINPERVAPVLRRLISPTNTRARIYDRDGTLLLDSRSLYGRGDVLRFDIPPADNQRPNYFQRQWTKLSIWIGRGDLPLYRDLGPENGRGYPEVTQALGGQKASIVRATEEGEVVVSVAIPVQRFRAVRGVLLLSTQGADIDQMVEAERTATFKVFAVLAIVMVVLSVLLAGTIAGPVRRLAEGAESVRRRIRARVEIPDFTKRRDEIGHLSGALRDMTNALYTRIEGIESFAADVSHELKNPLTSLRSAVETFPLAKTKESQDRLLAVIEHDVRRLDRLITDISDASRLDAELQRQESAPVDMKKLLEALVSVANDVPHPENVSVALTFEGAPDAKFIVPGHDSRLGQVIDNLIQNARSFSPNGGVVSITCRRARAEVEIVLDDNGPGIRPDAFEKIFERFYTDRPQHNFGQNSGLGLSISKQIIEAHGGTLRAENRTAAAGQKAVTGARFTVRLPAA